MINELKSEIAFLKEHNLDKDLWKESSLELIRRLTSDIKVTNSAQKRKLIEEVRDFLAKGKGNDDSFDFIFQENEKFFREIHIYHDFKDGVNKVTARIDRTIVDENGHHKPFENFITLDYTEEDNDDGEEGGDGDGGGLIIENISILGTKYVPFPANLVFAEKMFSKIAGDTVQGLNKDKTHYQSITHEAKAEIPDIFATPEQKEKDKELTEQARYKIWDKKKKPISSYNLDSGDGGNDIVMSNILAAMKKANVRDLDTDGLSEEDIFRNLVNKVSAITEEENKKLKRQAKEFFDPDFGNDSFNMKKEIANGAIIYEIERDRPNHEIKASINFAEKKDLKTGKPNKHVAFFDMVRMVYKEDPKNPGEFECGGILILGKMYPATKEWEAFATRFYSYLLHELSRGDSNHIDVKRLDEVLNILENEKQNPAYIGEKYLEELGVITDDKYEDDKEYAARMRKEDQLRMKKKYEALYNMELTMN